MEDLTTRMRENPWMVSTFVFGILILALLVNGSSGGLTGNAIAADLAGANVINFIDKDLAVNATLRNVSVVNGLYKITYDFNNSINTVYVTMNGGFIVNKLIPLVFLD